MTVPISERLVNGLLHLSTTGMPPEVIGKAKLCVLDTLGVALAGSLTSVGKIARQFAMNIGGKEEATLFRSGDRVSCVPAAYANGTMAFCHNFTDTTLSCVVHCGPAIVPTALAVAEREGNTGKEFLAAVIAGYDLMTRVGNALNSGLARMNHHRSGFHATATTGVFGACLTASKLLHLTPEQATSALGTAASYASGILAPRTSPGSETWKTHTGIAAQNGISAALLAHMGLQGPATILDGDEGFLKPFGWGKYDLGKLEENLGERFLIMDSAFKLYNCGHVWANPLDCLKQLRETHHFQPDDVAEIRVTVPTMYTYVMANSPEKNYPRNYAEAENHPHYLMAAMMLHGQVSLPQFEDRVIHDLRMKAMAGKVVIEVDLSLDAIFKETDKAPAKVRIVRKQNRTELELASDYPRGSPKNPATRCEIEQKFIGLSANAIGKEKALRIIAAVDSLEEQESVNTLMTVCCV